MKDYKKQFEKETGNKKPAYDALYSMKYIDWLEQTIVGLKLKLKAKNKALEFYADPETYLGVGFAFDKLCGGFINDFTDTILLGIKPGKRARQGLLAD